jgi:hypothetical protein
MDLETVPEVRTIPMKAWRPSRQLRVSLAAFYGLGVLVTLVLLSFGKIPIAPTVASWLVFGGSMAFIVVLGAGNALGWRWTVWVNYFMLLGGSIVAVQNLFRPEETAVRAGGDAFWGILGFLLLAALLMEHVRARRRPVSPE